MASVLSSPHFHNEEAACAYVEARLWPKGPACQHCGGVGRIGKLGGKSTRVGTYKCYQCRKPFTVKIGTIFEDSKVPMHIWLQAIYLIAGSKKGISSNQLHRTLGVTLKTAWFMSHRIREAMKSGGSLMGVDGGMVEADETFIGQRKGRVKMHKGGHHKMKVVSLIDRNSGSARSFVVDTVGLKDLGPILQRNISTNAHLMTDEWPVYKGIGWNFSAHSTVKHRNEEYVRKGQPEIHTNTVEGFFSVFKRGMKGIYQHCSEKHLHRYLAEYDFRYSHRAGTGCNDTDRSDRILAGVVGKRLTYGAAYIGA